MKKYFYITALFLFVFGYASQVKAEEAQKDTLIRASLPAVYYYAEDGKRYVFPNEKTYNSWFSDFGNVIVVSDNFLASVPIGGNVTYRPGIKMVKIETDPKVYHVSGGSVLRWVATEELAVQLYGNNWNTLIDDVPDAFFTNYTVGSAINSVYDLNIGEEVTNFTTINSNKGISQSTNPLYSNTEIKILEIPEQTIQKSTYRWTQKTVNADQYLHKNFKLESLLSGYVSTWHDDRNSQNEIMYQRMDQLGDSVSGIVRVSSNTSDSINGKTLYNDDLYVLWEDSSSLKRAIYLEKFGLNGFSVSEAVYTSTTFATSKNPDFVWNDVNKEFGVSWWDTRNGESGIFGNLFFGRITKGGVKNGDIVKITDNSELEFYPKIISAGENYLIFWQEASSKNLKVASVNNIGVLQKISTIVTSSQSLNFEISWDGTSAGVVWTDAGKIYYAKINNNALKLGENKELVSSNAGNLDIEWDGLEYAVVYEKNNDIYYFEIDNLGNLLTKEVNISNTTTQSTKPILKKSATGFALGWVELTDSVGRWDELVVAIRQ